MSFIPPGYGDLGKKSKDLFGKGFNYGKYNLEMKTKTPSGIEFKATVNSNHDSGKCGGNLETKYYCPDYNLSLKETMSTDSTLNFEVELEELMKGLKMTTVGSFVPQSGKKSGKIKSSFKRDYLNTNLDVDLDIAGPTVNGSAVTEYKGWVLGYQMAFDTAKSKLTKNNFAMGYRSLGTEMMCFINDANEFSSNIYHKVNHKTEVGTEMSWAAGTNATKFGIAAKYLMAPGSIYRAKINNAMQMGLSYQHELSNNVTMTTSTQIEGRNFNAGGHKLGFGLDFDL